MDKKTINLRDLPEELVRRAKACAALHGVSLKEFVSRAIASAIEKDIPAMHHMAAFLRTKPQKAVSGKESKRPRSLR
jgi:hypothetical protein